MMLVVKVWEGDRGRKKGKRETKRMGMRRMTWKWQWWQKGEGEEDEEIKKKRKGRKGGRRRHNRVFYLWMLPMARIVGNYWWILTDGKLLTDLWSSVTNDHFTNKILFVNTLSINTIYWQIFTIIERLCWSIWFSC